MAKDKFKSYDIVMAMSVLMVGTTFPIITLALMFDTIGVKSLTLLLLIVPYYCGLYRFRKTWGFI